MSQFTEDYLRGLGLSTRNNALAYGYSITATAAFGVLSETARPADIGRIFLFAVGASIAFAAVNAAVSRGFRARVQAEPPVVVALATSLGIVSISAGVGAAALLGTILRGWPAWLLAGILSTWIYLSVAALEVAVARGRTSMCPGQVEHKILVGRLNLTVPVVGQVPLELDGRRCKQYHHSTVDEPAGPVPRVAACLACLRPDPHPVPGQVCVLRLR